MRQISERLQNELKTQVLRNAFVARVDVGLVSTLDTRYISYSTTSRLSPLSKNVSMLKEEPRDDFQYATYEIDTYQANGKAKFMVNGLQSEYVLFDELSNDKNELSKTSFTLNIVSSQLPTVLPDITIDFGSDNFPTDFMIGDIEITNNKSRVFVLGEQVHITSPRTTITIKKMNKPKVRCQINKITLGTGLSFDDTTLQSVQYESDIDFISGTLPAENMSIKVIDFAGTYDLDNQNSQIEKFQKEQEVTFYIGYYLNDTVNNEEIEWIKLGTAYMDSWWYEERTLNLVAKDYLANYDYKFDGLELYDTWNEMLALEKYGFAKDHIKLYEFPQLVDNLPMKQIMQLQANMGAATLVVDEDGVISTKTTNLYTPVCEGFVMPNRMTLLPNMNKLDVHKDVYASFEHNTFKADGSAIFYNNNLSDPFVENRVFISTSISDGNGKFEATGSENCPYMFITFDDEGYGGIGNLDGMVIRFMHQYPKKITISGEEERGEISVPFTEVYQNDGFEFKIPEKRNSSHFVIGMDEMSRPNTRCYIDFFGYKEISKLSVNKELYIESFPVVQTDDECKLLEVVATTWKKSTEVKKLYSGTYETGDERKVTYTSTKPFIPTGFSGCSKVRPSIFERPNGTPYYSMELNISAPLGQDFYVEGYEYEKTQTKQRYNVLNKGTILTVENPLTSKLKKSINDWLVKYHKNNKVYSFDWRGIPSVQCGDIIDIETRNSTGVLIRVVENRISYVDGAFSMTTKGRRIEYDG